MLTAIPGSQTRELLGTTAETRLSWSTRFQAQGRETQHTFVERIKPRISGQRKRRRPA